MAPFDIVEVRRDPDVQAWFSACIEDMTEDAGIVCSFEDDIWPQGIFPPEDVRPPPHRQRRREREADFDPCVGDFVELEIQRSASTPSGWRRARVKSRQRGLFLVAPTERLEKGARGEVIAPRWRLRPDVPDRGGVAGLLLRVEIPIDPKLKDWLSSPEAAAAVGAAGQMSVWRQPPRGGDSRRGRPRDALLLVRCEPERSLAVVVGTEILVRRVRSELPSMLWHIAQANELAAATELREKALERRRRAGEGGQADPLAHLKSSKEFEADQTHVARLIGRKGSNVHALEAMYGVKFQVLDGPAYGEQKTVKILGADEASVQEALDNAQLVEETVDVPPQMNGWVIGRRHSTLNEMRNVSGLQACRLDRDTQKLVFVGTRHACHQAKELYTAHMLYFPHFKDMDEHMVELQEQLQEHGEKELLQWGAEVAGKGKGKLGEKGKDKGKFGDKGKAKGKGKGKSKGKDSYWEFKGKGKGRGTDHAFYRDASEEAFSPLPEDGVDDEFSPAGE